MAASFFQAVIAKAYPKGIQSLRIWNVQKFGNRCFLHPQKQAKRLAEERKPLSLLRTGFRGGMPKARGGNIRKDERMLNGTAQLWNHIRSKKWQFSINFELRLFGNAGILRGRFHLFFAVGRRGIFFKRSRGAKKGTMILEHAQIIKAFLEIRAKYFDIGTFFFASNFSDANI